MREVRKGREGQNDTNTVLIKFISKNFKLNLRNLLYKNGKQKINLLHASETQGDLWCELRQNQTSEYTTQTRRVCVSPMKITLLCESRIQREMLYEI